MGKEIVDWHQKVAMTAAEIIPSIIAQTPVIGDSAKKILNNLGYEHGVANGYLNSILKNLSARVNEVFCADASGLDGGLVYGRSGTLKSNFIVSRSVAAYLSSLTDSLQKPIALKGLVIALLHERMWQCKDSGRLYDQYSVMPLYEGIREITNRLALIVSLAIEIRNSIIQAISKFEPASELFKMANEGQSIQAFSETVRLNDLFDEHAHSECVSLSTCPMLLIERYMDLFSQHGAARFHYIPFPKPLEAPAKKAPPMLKSIQLRESFVMSPGLAVENIIQIKPYQFLNFKAAQNDNCWPYGSEVEGGYINLNPPFELWCDQGNNEQPDWVEDRIPDVRFVAHRQISNQEWDEYVENERQKNFSLE